MLLIECLEVLLEVLTEVDEPLGPVKEDVDELLVIVVLAEQLLLDRVQEDNSFLEVLFSGDYLPYDVHPLLVLLVN